MAQVDVLVAGCQRRARALPNPDVLIAGAVLKGLIPDGGVLGSSGIVFEGLRTVGRVERAGGIPRSVPNPYICPVFGLT
jgi:hypothetical protein